MSFLYQKVCQLLQETTDFELASNPATAPEILDKLAGKRKLKETVISNPNISQETWSYLFPDYSEKGIKNPIHDLWLLENPDFIGNQEDHELHNSYVDAIYKHRPELKNVVNTMLKKYPLMKRSILAYNNNPEILDLLKNN